MNPIPAPKLLERRSERRARPRPINLHERAELYGLEVTDITWHEWQLCLELASIDSRHSKR